MRILNVRLGFAANSSSTHYMVVLPQADEGSEFDDCVDDGYGWDFFTLRTEAGKRDYLLCILASSLRQTMGPTIARVAAGEMLGLRDRGQGGGIDHQSVFALPSNWDGVGVDDGFLEDFKAWLLDSKTVIVGGNDNSDGAHPGFPEDDQFRLPLPYESGSAALVAKKDGKTGAWTIFDRENGKRTRFLLTPGEVPTADEGRLHKSSTPDLVDVKITDKCSKGCSYCYQGSTPKGLHAKTADLETVANRLRDARVFEVAIGGGEPTEHPFFTEILEMFRKRGIVPNFTTRTLDWMPGANGERIVELCGGFALSVDNAGEMAAAAGAFDERFREKPGLRDKMSFQHVVGSGSLDVLKGVLEAGSRLRPRLTLLGFKETGRGGAFMKRVGGQVDEAQREWFDMAARAFKDNRWKGVGIDTTLASKSEGRLNGGVDRMFWRVSEGECSMYVDAVKMTMSESSYSDSSEPFGEGWLAAYETMGPKASGRVLK